MDYNTPNHIKIFNGVLMYRLKYDKYYHYYSGHQMYKGIYKIKAYISC